MNKAANKIFSLLFTLIGFISSFIYLPLIKYQHNVFIVLSIILGVIGIITTVIILLKPNPLTAFNGIVLFSVIQYYMEGVLLIATSAIESYFTNFIIPSFLIVKLLSLLIVFSYIVIIIHRKKEKIPDILKINKISNPDIILVGIFFIISYTLLNSYFLIPFYQNYIPSFYSIFNESLYQPRGMDLKIIIFSILGFAILPAFTEEFLFRGFLQSVLELNPFRKKITQQLIVIMIVTILFSTLHLSLLGILINIPNAILFSLLVIGTRSVFSSVIIHAIGNGFFSIFSMLVSNRLQNRELSEIIAPNALLGGVVCLIISVSALYYIFQKVYFIHKQ